jgi:hypothetical protein
MAFLFHQRGTDALRDTLDYSNNLELPTQLRTLPDASLKRLSEVSWVLAGCTGPCGHWHDDVSDGRYTGLWRDGTHRLCP